MYIHTLILDYENLHIKFVMTILIYKIGNYDAILHLAYKKASFYAKTRWTSAKMNE